MTWIGKAFAICFIVFAISACGSGNDACDGFVCEEGNSCVLENGSPVCVPDGDGGGGGGGGGEGDTCETSADCQADLDCVPGVNGVLTCQ